MWPLWLIVGVAVGAGVTVLVSGVIIAVVVERRRHRKLMVRHDLNRDLSQHNRPHLSITDIDIATLPRPMRSLRQSFQNPLRDSRFYSITPSEDKTRTFGDSSAESLANVNYLPSHAGQSHQWLSTSKSKHSKRKKKVIKLSVSAPAARSPLSVVTEVTECERTGSPEPIELPTHITPKVTPEKIAKIYQPYPGHQIHSVQGSIDGMPGVTDRDPRKWSEHALTGNINQSRSISMGSIMAPPPNCPLPSVPEDALRGRSHKMGMKRSRSDLRDYQREMALLNSPVIHPLSPKQGACLSKASNTFSDFRFGLIVDEVASSMSQRDNPTIHVSEPSDSVQSWSTSSLCEPYQRGPKHTTGDALETIDASSWKLPQGHRRLGMSGATTVQPWSRPPSIPNRADLLRHQASNSADTSSTKSNHEEQSSSCSISITTPDLFRHSIVGMHASVPESPRTKGHRRQNCVRIKNLTPTETRNRLSSQLNRLAEAESEDEINNADMESPTVGPVKPMDKPIVARPTRAHGELSLTIPKLKQPQALSLRVKRPGLFTRENQVHPSSPAETTSSIFREQPPSISTLNEDDNIIQSESIDYTTRFVYAGSPSSDPTKTASQVHDYSPVSPSLGQEKKQEQSTNYSPASHLTLFSGYPTSVSGISPLREKAQLHGPRSIPLPSLRASNSISPHRKQARNEQMGSPIRRVSTANRHQRRTSEDDIKKSIAMLESLKHGAHSTFDLPEVNAVQATVPGVTRTPSSRYADSPGPLLVTKSRQRSRTIAGHANESTLSPIGREKMKEARMKKGTPQQKELWLDTRTPSSTKYRSSPSSISIWEDILMRDNSPEVVATGPSRNPMEEQPQQQYISQKQTRKSGQEPMEKDVPWRTQQSADLVTSRAKAFEHRIAAAAAAAVDTRSEKTRPKLDGFWGDKCQDEVKTPTATRPLIGSGIVGPRKRSHTINAGTMPAMQTGMHMQRPYEGIGLGLRIGTLSPVSFVNEMERDGIGKLR